MKTTTSTAPRIPTNHITHSIVALQITGGDSWCVAANTTLAATISGRLKKSIGMFSKKRANMILLFRSIVRLPQKTIVGALSTSTPSLLMLLYRPYSLYQDSLVIFLPSRMDASVLPTHHK